MVQMRLKSRRHWWPRYLRKKSHANPDQSRNDWLALDSYTENEPEAGIASPSSAEPAKKPPKRHIFQPNSWVQGVRMCFYGAASVLTLNIIFTITACAIAFRKFRQPFSTSATLFTGNCTSIKNTTMGLHLVINILSTLLLAAGNYCMQGLVAPDRKDINKMHAQQKWLDVGTTSIRNLKIATCQRRILWSILLLTSVPIHLLYNSAIFSSLGVNEYITVVASKGLDLSTADISDYEPCWEANVKQSFPNFLAYNKQGKFRNLTSHQCLDEFSNEFVPGRGTLVLLVDYNNTHPPNSIFWGNVITPWINSNEGGPAEGKALYPQFLASSPDNVIEAHYWTTPGWKLKVPILGNMTDINSSEEFNTAYSMLDYHSQEAEDLTHLFEITRYLPEKDTLHQTLNNGSNWENSSWAAQVSFDKGPSACALGMVQRYYGVVGEYPLEGCLAIDDGIEHCQLLFSPPICIIVICCNAAKVVCMLLAMRDDRDEILLTIGDAIASFIQCPDSYTAGQCWMSKNDVSAGLISWERCRRWFSWSIQGHSPMVSYWRYQKVPHTLGHRKRWWQAANISHWVLTIAICSSTIGVTCHLLVDRLQFLNKSWKGFKPDFKSLWDLGFGSVSQYSLFGNDDNPILSIILLANAPQVIISVIYFFGNALLTSMLLSAEYDSFAIRRKPLRVSWPSGSQRSTYFLTIPYKYSIPSMTISAILHWLVSQSLFFTVITIHVILPNPYSVQKNVLKSSAWSPIPTIFAICLVLVILFILLALGMVPMKSRMPLAGNCSAAISASCHPPLDDSDATKPVMWGEVSPHQGDDESVSDCGQSSTTNTTIQAPSPKGFRYSTVTAKQDQRNDNGRDEQESILLDANIVETIDDTVYAHCSFTSKDVNVPSGNKLYM